MQSKIDFPTPLSEKYRPRRIQDFVGLEKPKKVLTSFLEKPFASAWLFLGPSGIGKTTMAQALAEQLPAEIQHIPSRQCDLESVENAVRRCWYIPWTGKFHLVLVDEADQMTQAAQLAFLSKLDSTACPPNTIFIFTANSTNLLEQRFLSRCRVLEFSTADMNGNLTERLAEIWKKETSHTAKASAFEKLAEGCQYNIRDALMKLEIEILAGSFSPNPEKPRSPDETENWHRHHCCKCGHAWEHGEGDCALPYKSNCKACSPEQQPKTIYQLRAEKAVQTRIRNISAAILAVPARRASRKMRKGR